MQYLLYSLLLVGAFADQEFLKKDPTVVASRAAAAVPAQPAQQPVQKPVAPRQLPQRTYAQPSIMDYVKYYGNPLNWQGIFQMAVFRVRIFLNTYVTQILLYGGIALGLYLTVGRLAIWQIKNAMSK